MIQIFATAEFFYRGSAVLFLKLVLFSKMALRYQDFKKMKGIYLDSMVKIDNFAIANTNLYLTYLDLCNFADTIMVSPLPGVINLID